MFYQYLDENESHFRTCQLRRDVSYTCLHYGKKWTQCSVFELKKTYHTACNFMKWSWTEILHCQSVSIKYGLRTADCGLRTMDCGLGIKHGLGRKCGLRTEYKTRARYKTRTTNCVYKTALER